MEKKVVKLQKRNKVKFNNNFWQKYDEKNKIDNYLIEIIFVF